MATKSIASAVQRLEHALRQRPSFGLHDDPPATARWAGGLRMISSHPSGAQVASDMAVELGGTGDQVSPGWLFRAGLASCTATMIVVFAAQDGIELTALDVVATSRSDIRGALDMREPDGSPAPVGPLDLGLSVRIAARDVSADRLEALVRKAWRCSPVGCVAEVATAVDLRIEIA